MSCFVWSMSVYGPFVASQDSDCAGNKYGLDADCEGQIFAVRYKS